MSLSEPDWVDTARQRAPEVEARLADDGHFVEFQHTEGNAILPGTRAVLWDGTENRNLAGGVIDDPIESGTTLFLWPENGGLRWQRDGRPSAVDPQPPDGQYVLWMHRNGAEYFGTVSLG